MMMSESPTTGGRLEPNLFQLRGTGTQVSFQPSSIAGEPQLTYTDAQGSRTFSGEGVRSQDSDIGKIVSVTLQLNPDSQIVTLSLLVPSIKFAGQSIDFETVAIKATKRSGFLAVQPGPLQTYSTIHLEGTASLIEFDAPPSP